MDGQTLERERTDSGRNRPEPPRPRPGGFYQRDRSIHPPSFEPTYKTSVLRSPRNALLSLESSLSELTGPVFSHNDIGPLDNDLLRNYAHFGTKRREDGRIVWKRDPNLVKGFVPTELWRFVRDIKSPTIYILGGASNIVPADAQRQLKEILPNVQIVTMPGLGHYPDQEAPQDFLKLVETFLQGSSTER